MNIQQTVFEALNRALENGFDMRKGYPQLEHMDRQHNLEQIAIDLCDHDTDFEEMDYLELVTHIEAWQKSKE